MNKFSLFCKIYPKITEPFQMWLFLGRSWGSRAFPWHVFFSSRCITVAFYIYIVVLSCNIKQLQTKRSNTLLSHLIQPRSELAFCKLLKIVHLNSFFFSLKQEFWSILMLISFFYPKGISISTYNMAISNLHSPLLWRKDNLHV